MTTKELVEKLELIQKLKCETPTLEIKSAKQGCPRHLYDSLSSFSNQDDGESRQYAGRCRNVTCHNRNFWMKEGVLLR